MTVMRTEHVSPTFRNLAFATYPLPIYQSSSLSSSSEPPIFPFRLFKALDKALARSFSPPLVPAAADNDEAEPPAPPDDRGGGALGPVFLRSLTLLP